jgi:hypothetical protein
MGPSGKVVNGASTITRSNPRPRAQNTAEMATRAPMAVNQTNLSTSRCASSSRAHKSVTLMGGRGVGKTERLPTLEWRENRSSEKCVLWRPHRPAVRPSGGLINRVPVENSPPSRRSDKIDTIWWIRRIRTPFFPLTIIDRDEHWAPLKTIKLKLSWIAPFNFSLPFIISCFSLYLIINSAVGQLKILTFFKKYSLRASGKRVLIFSTKCLISRTYDVRELHSWNFIFSYWNAYGIASSPDKENFLLKSRIFRDNYSMLLRIVKENIQKYSEISFFNDLQQV